MGGVVGDVVSGIGDLGQDVISGVDQALTGIDDALPQEAKIAAAIYLASQGIPTGAEGAALSSAGASEAALTATDLAMGGGGSSYAVPTFAAPAAGSTSLLGSSSVMNPAFTTSPLEGSQFVTQGALNPAATVGQGAALGSTSFPTSSVAANAANTGLLGSVINFAKENPLTALGLGATAASALAGNQPTSSTATTSIDPDVKAAYLRNLEEARMVGAGLGQRQFAPFPEYNLGMVQKYMNPYEQEVVQNTLADIERARQGQISAEGARATAARAFGGSRQGVTRALVDEAALRDVGNLASQLRLAGFRQAQNLGLSQEDLRRQYEQQRLDAARGLPLERLNIAQGALSLQPARIGESTTSPIFRNPAASGLGGALAGGRLGSLIGGTQNPEYAGYGAGLGGLLGLFG